MPMKVQKIKDNTQLQKGELSGIKNLTDKIVNQTLGKLANDEVLIFPDFANGTKDDTKNQMILQSVNGKYRTGNLMGFLGFEDERLIIKSRFCEDKKEDFFFHYLLEQALDVPIVMDLKLDVNQSNQSFNYLLYVFPYYLKRAIRKGLFKKYVRNRYNDWNVKGTIDIARHIKLNTPFTGRIAYSQREFSYDNYLMELVRHTIEYIKGKPYGKTILSKVKDEESKVKEATPRYKRHDRQKIIEVNKKNILRHAYFHEYITLQRLCLLILQNLNHRIETGSRQIYGILFDGAWLWEEYVNTLINGSFYHPSNKDGTGAQRLFNKETGDKNTGLIYPDFISRDAETRIIADAKYKPLKNIANKDYLQVLAYMFRFDAKKGYYLYPESKGNDDVELKLNKGSTYENNVKARNDIRVIKHGLRIPTNAADYESFKKQMAESEKAFQSAFARLKTA